MKQRILVVEDETAIASVLDALLTEAGYEVTLATDGVQGLQAFHRQSFSLILLDLMMPQVDGYTICRQIRQESQVPIVVLTALDGEDAQVKAFQLKADDYITKPFGMMEFIARVRAVLRRAGKEEKENDVLETGDLQIQVKQHQVLAKGEKVTLTLKEFELLKFLMENKGIVLTRDRLLGHVWGYDFDGETRTVDVHVRTLRQKLGETGRLVETVRGVGYRMADKGGSQG